MNRGGVVTFGIYKHTINVSVFEQIEINKHETPLLSSINLCLGTFYLKIMQLNPLVKWKSSTSLILVSMLGHKMSNLFITTLKYLKMSLYSES